MFCHENLNSLCDFFFWFQNIVHMLGGLQKWPFFSHSRNSNIIVSGGRVARPRARRIRNSTRAWHIWAGAPRIGQLDATVVVVSWGNKPGATLGDTVVCSSSSSSILLLRWPKGRVWRVQLWHRLTATTGPVGFILFIHRYIQKRANLYQVPVFQSSIECFTNLSIRRFLT